MYVPGSSLPLTFPQFVKKWRPTYCLGHREFDFVWKTPLVARSKWEPHKDRVVAAAVADDN